MKPTQTAPRAAAAASLRISPRSLRGVGARYTWSLDGRIDRVYETSRFREGQPPRLVRRPGAKHPAIRQS